jgi:hypothetical protein
MRSDALGKDSSTHMCGEGSVFMRRRLVTDPTGEHAQ